MLNAAAGTHGWTTVGLDGKTLPDATDVQLPGVHLLAASAHEAGVVLCQFPVGPRLPRVRQCFKLTRTRTLRDRTTGVFKITTGTVCGVTSLPRDRADAARLLEIVRVHWGIENKVFHVRDQTPGEDARPVRKWSAPVVSSTLGNRRRATRGSRLLSYRRRLRLLRNDTSETRGQF